MLPETEERQVSIVQKYVDALKYHASWFSYLFHPWKPATSKVELVLQFGVNNKQQWDRVMCRLLELLTEERISVAEFSPEQVEEEKPKKKEKAKKLSFLRSCE